MTATPKARARAPKARPRGVGSEFVYNCSVVNIGIANMLLYTSPHVDFIL
jgi:hypothetical protein